MQAINSTPSLQTDEKCRHVLRSILFLNLKLFILSYLCNQAYSPAYSLAMWIVKGKSYSKTNPKRFWFHKNDNLLHSLENLARNWTFTYTGIYHTKSNIGESYRAISSLENWCVIAASRSFESLSLFILVQDMSSTIH